MKTDIKVSCSVSVIITIGWCVGAAIGVQEQHLFVKEMTWLWLFPAMGWALVLAGIWE